MLKVSRHKLETSFEWISSSEFDNRAYVCRTTGKVYWQSDFDPGLDETPEDVDDPEKYLLVPSKRDLDLGTQLVLDFVRSHAPELHERVQTIFSRRGAYRRFKELLIEQGRLEEWYAFSNAAEADALAAWCKENNIELIEEELD